MRLSGKGEGAATSTKRPFWSSR